MCNLTIYKDIVHRPMLVAVVAIIAAILTACSSDDEFRIEGHIEGNPTMNLRVLYFNQDALQQTITAVREGKFEFTGHSSVPTIVELYDNDYRLLGCLLAADGQSIRCTVDRSNPYKMRAKGSKSLEQWMAAQQQMADVLMSGGAAANAAIAQYVGDNPTELASTLLMITAYNWRDHQAEADSLLAIIAPEARPGHLVSPVNFMLERLVSSSALGEMMSVRYFDYATDSILYFNPGNSSYSLLAVSNQQSSRRDSVLPLLRNARTLAPEAKLQILDYSVEPDSISWRRGQRADSATWARGWAPGGIAATSLRPLGIPGVPYYIVCDSTGAQILRTGSSAQAAHFLRAVVNDK